MGLALTVDQFHELADRLRKAGVKFIIEPHLRFEGMPGEQYTMFFKDPSGTYVPLLSPHDQGCLQGTNVQFSCVVAILTIL